MRKAFIDNARVFVIFLLIAVAGCVMMAELDLYKKRPIKFSHKAHGEEAELSCEDCHTRARESEEAGMPGPGTCRLCHDTEEEIKERLQPFVVEGELIWSNVTGISEELTFSHQRHLEEGMECGECHTGIAESEAVTEKLRVTKDDCFDCHADLQVEKDCGVCHAEVDRDWEPPSHESNWERYHGQVVRSGMEPPFTNRCELCHTRTDCSSCHQDEEGRPRSHNSYWRLRGHGIKARMDRDRCATCHQVDYCDRCHRNTTPLSHSGSWGGAMQRHCFTCHFPISGNGCVTCHKTTPGHLQAPALHDNVTHNTASESACRDCHLSLGTLTHPDNGDSCRNCHR